MLSDRQKNILNLLVDLYIETNQPIGSNTLVQGGIKASSATIRNELVKLEEFDLIEKTHTSSGRVPSANGYRFFVDHLLKPHHIHENDLRIIRQFFDKRFNATNELIELSADILSEITNYTVIALGPEIKKKKLSNFTITPLGLNQFVATIITNTGYVKSRIFFIPESMSVNDIDKVSQLVHEKLLNQDFLAIYHKLRTEMPLFLQRYFQYPKDVLDLLEEMFRSSFEHEIYVSGSMNLLNNFSTIDVSKFKSFHSLFNDHDEVSALVSTGHQKIAIKVSEELESSLLQDMSLMSINYKVAEESEGTLAILGPMNMPYGQLFSILELFQKELNHHFEHYF